MFFTVTAAFRLSGDSTSRGSSPTTATVPAVPLGTRPSPAGARSIDTNCPLNFPGSGGRTCRPAHPHRLGATDPGAPPRSVIGPVRTVRRVIAGHGRSPEPSRVASASALGELGRVETDGRSSREVEALGPTAHRDPHPEVGAGRQIGRDAASLVAEQPDHGSGQPAGGGNLVQGCLSPAVGGEDGHAGVPH